MNQTGINPFNIFRLYRKAWSLGILTLLLGGWLSVLCLHCLDVAADTAKTDTLAAHSQEHCHSVPAKQDQQNRADQCDGACDCATVAAVPEKLQDSPVALVNAALDLQFLASRDGFASLRMMALDVDIPLYCNPDHSRLLPFEHFRILLI